MPHTSTTERYTLSLHDALPISAQARPAEAPAASGEWGLSLLDRDGVLITEVAPATPAERAGLVAGERILGVGGKPRSEEHTSELQSQFHLVCRLLLEKKKTESA